MGNSNTGTVSPLQAAHIVAAAQAAQQAAARRPIGTGTGVGQGQPPIGPSQQQQQQPSAANIVAANNALQQQQQQPPQQQQQQQTNQPGLAMGPAVGLSAPGSGTVKYISAGGLWGLSGLIDSIRQDGPEPNVLALGNDLTGLGLDLGSEGPLWSTFVSPFLDPPTTAAQPNFTLPPCYTLPTPPPPPLTKIPNFGDESLLYIFYAFPRDQLAEHAAQELYNRNWRFHKELRMWITRDEGAGQRGQGFERGYYSVWVPERWERERREMVVRYEDLEERGAMPVAGAGNAGNGASAVGGPVGVGVGVVGGGAQQGTIGGAAVASQQPGPSAVQQAQAAVAAGLGLPGVLGAPGIGVGVGNGAAVQQVLEKALRGGLPPNSSLPPSQPTAGIPPTSQPAIQSLLAQFNMNPSSLSVPQLALLQQLQQQWPQLQPGAGARP